MNGYFYCRNGCGIELHYDHEIHSSRPLEGDNRPHNCPVRSGYGRQSGTLEAITLDDALINAARVLVTAINSRLADHEIKLDVQTKAKEAAA